MVLAGGREIRQRFQVFPARSELIPSNMSSVQTRNGLSDFSTNESGSLLVAVCSFGGLLLSASTPFACRDEILHSALLRCDLAGFLSRAHSSGTCHGSARGQDRFMLSLFGYDPKGTTSGSSAGWWAVA